MSDDAWIDVGASEELRGTTLRECPGRAREDRAELRQR